MDFLKIKPICFLLLLVSSCGPGETISITLPVEYDTYVSSSSESNFSTSSLLVVEDSTNTAHTLIKLPTGDSGSSYDADADFERLFATPLEIIFFPMYIITKVIFAAMFGCPDGEIPELTSSSLNTAEFRIDLNEESAGDLTSAFQLSDLSESWHGSATWNRRHSFSSNQNWSTPGGTLGSSLSTTNTVDGNTMKFDVTEYFRGLLNKAESGQSTHFGLMIKASSTLNQIALKSSNNSNGPRVYAEYDGCDPTNYDDGVSGSSIKKQKGHTYYLKADHK